VLYFKTLNKFIDVERLSHSIKTALACVIGLTLARVIGLPADQWVVITIIVVMCAQLYVGSVVQKAYLRFLGTMIGCLFAIITILTVGDSHTAVVFIIALSSFIFSYLATSQESMTYAGTLGAVTTAIIMLGQQPTVIFALERFLEIAIGLLIATLISQFILPIHARTHLRRAQAATLTQLRDFYVKALTSNKESSTSTEEFDYHDLDEAIVKSLLKQRQLAKESKREPLGSAFNPDDFMESLLSEREILRSITFMHTALLRMKTMQTIFKKSSNLQKFNETILKALDVIIRVIETENPMNEHIHVPSLSQLKDEIQQSTHPVSRDELFYSNGFLFSAEFLIESLIKLAKIYHIPVYQEV